MSKNLRPYYGTTTDAVDAEIVGEIAYNPAKRLFRWLARKLLSFILSIVLLGIIAALVRLSTISTAIPTETTSTVPVVTLAPTELHTSVPSEVPTITEVSYPVPETVTFSPKYSCSRDFLDYFKEQGQETTYGTTRYNVAKNTENSVFYTKLTGSKKVNGTEMEISINDNVMRGVAFLHMPDGLTWTAVTIPSQSQVEGPWVDLQMAFLVFQFKMEGQDMVIAVYIPWEFNYTNVEYAVFPAHLLNQVCPY